MNVSKLRSFIRIQAIHGADIIAIVGSWVALGRLHDQSTPTLDIAVVSAIAIGSMVITMLARPIKGLGAWRQGALVVAITAPLMAAAVLHQWSNAGFLQAIWMQWFVLAPMSILALRTIGWMIDRALLRRDIGRESVVLVGSTNACDRVRNELHLNNHDTCDSTVVATVLLEDDSRAEVVAHTLTTVLKPLRSPRVIVCGDDAHVGATEQVITILRDYPVTVQWAPQLDIPDCAMRLNVAACVVDIRASPLDERQLTLKWLEDKILACIIVMIVALPMAVVALLVKITSPGPVLFTQDRHGLNGQVIRVFKFRSMRSENSEPYPWMLFLIAAKNALRDIRQAIMQPFTPSLEIFEGSHQSPSSNVSREENELRRTKAHTSQRVSVSPASSTTSSASSSDEYPPSPQTFRQTDLNDPRLTPIGAFIRQTSLDELPQIFNVLKGNMSVVGPRPHAVQHNKQYTDTVGRLMERHYIKPGITGLAQVSGARGATRTIRDMRRRVSMDLIYMHNWSLLLDAKILFMTAFRGIFTRQP